MKQQYTLQPKLRFPEFEGDWISYSFKEIFNFTTGKNIKQKEAAPHFETPCVRYGELYYMYKEVISNIINYTNLDKSELKFSEGDEILLPSAGEDSMDIGSASALTLKDVAIGRTINILKPKNKNVYSSIFASYYINQKLRIKISGLAKGVSISNVYNTDLQTLFIKLPSIPEQQKIADYLSTIDTKINLLEEKKAQLALYKKAMMQKLFAQEIRFKEDKGNDFPEWKEKRLGDIGKITTGKLDANAMSANGEYRFYTCAKEFYKIDKYAFDCEALLISGNGANVGYIHHYNGKFNAYQRTYVLTDLEDNFKFIKFQLEQFLHKRIFKEKKVGNTPYIVLSTLTDMLLQVPVREEQQKIADFLSSIDESIEKVNEQICQTQNFKKAMLQQLFV